LQIQVFHFFISAPYIDEAAFGRLHHVACAVIETIVHYDQAGDLAGMATSYVQKMMVLAALTILRIAKSHLSQAVDAGRSRESYFESIRLAGKMSVQNTDLASRVAGILTQLWSSKKVFRQPDGSIDSLTLQCRNRFSMSIVFDCFWRWRQEFGSENTSSDSNTTLGKLASF
jgi:transcriptional regulatory protein LEU3